MIEPFRVGRYVFRIEKQKILVFDSLQDGLQVSWSEIDEFYRISARNHLREMANKSATSS